MELVEPQPGQAAPVDNNGNLSGYFSYKLLDPKANPYGLLTWDPARISRDALTRTERQDQLRFSDAEFEPFKTQLASIETKGRTLDESYLAVSRSGEYLGRYQMGQTTGLIAAGYMDKAGGWTAYAQAQGVSSRQDFLNNPAAQDDALRRLTDKNVEFAVRTNLDLSIGIPLDGKPLTGAGLLLGAHNSPGNLRAYVESQGQVNGVDDNGFGIANYVVLGDKVQPNAATASTPPAYTTSPTNGHWEYPTTSHNAMGDFPGAAEPVWVADAPSTASTASTATTAVQTSSPGRTSATTAPHTDVIHHPDGSTTYGFTAKANSADGTIQRGDTVTQVFDAQGQLSYYSVTHREPGKNGETTVMERIPPAGPGEATNTFSQWVGNTLQFQGQWDADGARVGDRYITAGVTYSRSSAADGSTHWLDPNGLTVDERVQQSFEQETRRHFSAAPPITLEDPADNAAPPADSTPQPTTPEPATPDPEQTSSASNLSSEAFEALQAGLNQIASMSSQPGVLYADASSYTDSGIISDAGPGTAEPSPPSNTATASTIAAQQSANALGLMNSIVGLQHWDGMNDLQRSAAVVSIYNALDKVNDNVLPGDLGSVAGALGLLNALEQGNMGAALYSGLGLVESLTFNTAQGAGLVSSQLGGNFLPALGFVLAIDSGDPVSIASSGVALYGAMTGAAWAGPVGLGIALAGALLGSLFADNDIPMREGLAHAAWDSAGNTIILTDQDNEGGGATAASWMGSLVDALQTQLAGVHDAAGNPYALVPNLLPAIGFAYDPDGFNLTNGAQGFVYLRWTDEQGLSQTRYYDGAGNRGDGTSDTLAGDFMQHAQRAIAPDWAVTTALAHYQQGHGIALPQAASSLPHVLADGLQQSLQAITLDLPVESAFHTTPATPATPVNQALLDIDGDGYLERSQWLGTEQQALAIDANGDQQIAPDELLSLDGNTPSLHNLRWLDANCDQLIDTRDPAFAAIRLWRDGNADGYYSDDDPSDQLQTLSQAGILAIDFSHSPPSLVRADGSRQTLTVQELTGDVLGVRYQAVAGGILQQGEQANNEPATLTLHAVNTLAFEGQADHVHGGEATENLAPNTLNVGRVIQAGDSALSTVARSGTVFVPLQTSTGSSTHNPVRQVTAAMVRSADSANWLPLAALALGASAGAGAAPATTDKLPLPTSAEPPSPSREPPLSAVFDAHTQSYAQDPIADSARLGASSPASPASLAGFDQTAATQPSSTHNADFEKNTGLAQYSYASVAINSVVNILPDDELSISSIQPSQAFTASHTIDATDSITPPSLPSVNTPPQVTGEMLDSDEDIPLHFQPALLLANDSDDQPLQVLRISAVGDAQHGSVALLADGSVQFTPEADYFGSASFHYSVADGYGGQASAEVLINLAPVNDAPLTQDELLWGKRDVSYTFTPAALLANDSDIDSDHASLHISAIANSQHGSAQRNPDGSVFFTPEAGYSGRASFDYSVQDAQGASSLATAYIDLSHININPLATDDSFVGYEDIAFNISAEQLLINDSDADNAPEDLHISAVTHAQHGVVSLQTDGSVRFVPEADFSGTASFSYQVSDGDGGQTWAQAQLDIQAVNDAPVIEAIFYGRPVYGYTTVHYAGSGDGDSGRIENIFIYDAAQALDLVNSRSLFAPYGNDSYQQVVPTYYRNGHMRPLEVHQVDATVSNSDGPSYLTDDRYRQMGLIEAYDPDGDSSALTFTVASGPQHGHAWTNQYTDPSATIELDHTQAGAYWIPQTGAWQYYSQRGDGYTGADPFSIAVTDAQGASTQLTLNTQHAGSAISGSGGKKPVTLDLDGNGLNYLRLDDSQAHFDVNADGWRDHLAWVGAGDGLLVRDIGADRQIDRFDEISFTGYKPGAKSDLEGLQAFDSNHNGLLDKLDQRWGEFGAWQDNGNGLSEAGEFQTLDEIGITQISLHSDQQVRQLDGVTELGQSQFTWADGRTGAVGDVVLAVELTVPDTAPQAELPAEPQTAKQQQVQESVAQAQAYLSSLARQEQDDDIDYSVSPAPVALPPLPPMTAMTPQHLALLMVQAISALPQDSPDIRPMQSTSPQDVHQALADIQAQWEQASNPALLSGGGT